MLTPTENIRQHAIVKWYILKMTELARYDRSMEPIVKYSELFLTVSCLLYNPRVLLSNEEHKMLLRLSPWKRHNSVVLWSHHNADWRWRGDFIWTNLLTKIHSRIHIMQSHCQEFRKQLDRKPRCWKNNWSLNSWMQAVNSLCKQESLKACNLLMRYSPSVVQCARSVFST